MKQTPDSHQTDAQIYGRLLGYVAPYWLAFVLSMVGFALYSAANVGFSQLVGYIVDTLGGKDPLAGSEMASWMDQWVGDTVDRDRLLIPILIVVMVFMRGMGTFIGNYFITLVGTNLVHNLRTELFDRLLCLPSKFYDQNAMGHLVAKVTFHVTQVTGAATDAVRVIIREGFTVIGFLGYLFYLNWKLTVIFLSVAPVIAFLVNFAGKRFRKISGRIQDTMGEVTHVASEAVQGYREVRTFGAVEQERERFYQVSNNNRRQSMKMVVTASIATPVVQLVVAAALAGLVWMALDPVLLSNMSSGDVVAFIVTGGLLAKPIRQLSEVNSTVQKGLAAAEDIFDVFDEALEVDEGHLELDQVKGKVEFRNVSFAYEDGGQKVLNDISFVAEPGETIALVGKSGSGKSTLASLIPRFYTPMAGTILIDDVPIDELALTNLRSHMALVSQDVTLFNDTVARNIAYGSLQRKSAADIREAAKKAFALNFIDELDMGFDTLVGDDGVLLSGGQRQRIAIARAFLKDAPILILDEATSALDSESERYIQSALEAVSAGRTTIVIAHRLSTIESADRILVIEKGRIVEQGSHADLLKQRGVYASLHNHQAEEASSVEAPVSKEFKPVPTPEKASVTWFPDDFSFVVNAWYNDSTWVKLLSPLSWIYRSLARHKKESTEPWKAPVPVIVVGNITVGGTGKSPLVSWLVDQLKQLGHKPGIVSRGYGGHSNEYPIEVTPLSDPAEVGDEAVMLARRTEVPMVVDPDRCRAVQTLVDTHEVDIVISDDGLQHYALDRDVEIAVVDGQRGLGNGLCLPAGPLREPSERLQSVDFVFVNSGTGSVLGPVASQIKPPLHMSLVPLELQPFSAEATVPPTGTVHAVAGIGNPNRFFTTLRQMGLEVIEHPFPDHHQFTLNDLSFGDSLPVVMTEKDAVKCRLLNPSIIHTNFWFLPMDVEVSSNFLPGLLSKLGMNISEIKSVNQ